MLITPPNIQFFFTGLETRFWTAYSLSTVWHDRVAMTIPVSTEQWASGWIGMLDRMKLWSGARQIHTPAPQTYLVPIQPFELTEEIDEFKLKDDAYGIYYPVVSLMGESTKKWPDFELRDLLQNTGAWTGTYQNGLDGLSHWNTAHPVDFYDSSKGTYSNDFTGGGFTVNGVLVGGSLGVNSFATLWEEIASRKSETGEALGLMADCTMAAAQLKVTLDTILQTQFFGTPTIGNLTGFVGSTENVLKGWTDRLIVPDLNAQPNVWYMLVCNKPIKPFQWLLREAPDFVYRINPQDPKVFDEHVYLYGSRARGTPAWGFAWLSARSGP